MLDRPMQQHTPQSRHPTTVMSQQRSFPSIGLVCMMTLVAASVFVLSVPTASAWQSAQPLTRRGTSSTKAAQSPLFFAPPTSTFANGNHPYQNNDHNSEQSLRQPPRRTSMMLLSRIQRIWPFPQQQRRSTYRIHSNHTWP